MRAIFAVLGLLVALGIGGLIVKKQLATSPPALPSLAAVPAGADAEGSKPAVTVQDQSKTIQRQYTQAIDSAMQQVRPVSDDK